MSRFLQVLLALAGLAITVVLGYATWRNEQSQTRIAYMALFSETSSAAADRCDQTMLTLAFRAAAELEDSTYTDLLTQIEGDCARITTEQAQAMVAEGATPEVAANAFPDLAVQAEQAALPAPPPVIEASPRVLQEATTQAVAAVELRLENLNLQRQESAPTKGSPTGSGESFAVLASYAVPDESTYDDALGAAAHFRKLQELTKVVPDELRLYRTQQSNHFAIVLAPQGEDTKARRARARDLVAQARREGWAVDAFVQVDRDWIRCSGGASGDDVRRCAGRG